MRVSPNGLEGQDRAGDVSATTSSKRAPIGLRLADQIATEHPGSARQVPSSTGSTPSPPAPTPVEISNMSCRMS
jgi:hypothetical protein